MELLDQKYFHNTLGDYLLVLGTVFIGISLIKLFKKRFFIKIKQWSQHTVNTFDDFLVDTIDRLGIPAIYLVISYAGLRYLTFPPKVEAVLDNAAIVAITFFAIRLISSIVWIVLKSYVHRLEHGEEKVKQLSGLMVIINILIWILGILFLFDNMDTM